MGYELLVMGYELWGMSYGVWVRQTAQSTKGSL